MPAEMPLRASIPAFSRSHRGSAAPRWTGRRVIGTLLGVWAAAATLLAAVIIGIVWDLRP